MGTIMNDDEDGDYDEQKTGDDEDDDDYSDDAIVDNPTNVDDLLRWSLYNSTSIGTQNRKQWKYMREGYIFVSN